MITSAANGGEGPGGGGGGGGTDCEWRVSCACSNSYYTIPQGGRFKTISLGLDIRSMYACLLQGSYLLSNRVAY